MTHAIDHLTRTTSQSSSRGDRAVQTKPPHPARARGLSDCQAVIAVMITRGATCQDIALELMLPLRTVEAHLHQALQILGLSRIEDLTYVVIAANYERTPLAASGQSAQRRTTGSTEPAGGATPSKSLMALDAA